MAGQQDYRRAGAIGVGICLRRGTAAARCQSRLIEPSRPDSGASTKVRFWSDVSGGLRTPNASPGHRHAKRSCARRHLFIEGDQSCGGALGDPGIKLARMVRRVGSRRRRKASAVLTSAAPVSIRCAARAVHTSKLANTACASTPVSSLIRTRPEMAEANSAAATSLTSTMGMCVREHASTGAVSASLVNGAARERRHRGRRSPPVLVTQAREQFDRIVLAGRVPARWAASPSRSAEKTRRAASGIGFSCTTGRP